MVHFANGGLDWRTDYPLSYRGSMQWSSVCWWPRSPLLHTTAASKRSSLFFFTSIITKSHSTVVVAKDELRAFRTSNVTPLPSPAPVNRLTNTNYSYWPIKCVLTRMGLID